MLLNQESVHLVKGLKIQSQQQATLTRASGRRALRKEAAMTARCVSTRFGRVLVSPGRMSRPSEATKPSANFQLSLKGVS